MSEKNAVARIEGEGPQPAATSVIQVIERMASLPDINIDSMERLLQMQERILDRQAQVEFSEAMARVQAQLPAILRKKKNTHTGSKYAEYESIAKAIKPIYTAEGFSTSFTEGDATKPDHIRINGVLRHRAGHKEDHYFVEVAIDKVGLKGNDNKTLTHAEGSSFTYGRRYLTCLMFDVATTEDNDGNGGVEKITKAQLEHLEKLIKDANADRAKFLETLEVDRLEDLPANNFKIASVALNARIKAAKAEAQE